MLPSIRGWAREEEREVWLGLRGRERSERKEREMGWLHKKF
jgi:hypothetical protein